MAGAWSGGESWRRWAGEQEERGWKEGERKRRGGRGETKEASSRRIARREIRGDVGKRYGRLGTWDEGVSRQHSRTHRELLRVHMCVIVCVAELRKTSHVHLARKQPQCDLAGANACCTRWGVEGTDANLEHRSCKNNLPNTYSLLSLVKSSPMSLPQIQKKKNVSRQQVLSESILPTLQPNSAQNGRCNHSQPSAQVDLSSVHAHPDHHALQHSLKECVC